MPKWEIIPCIFLGIFPGFVYMSAVRVTTDTSVRAPCSGSLNLTCSSNTVGEFSRIYMSWGSSEDELCKVVNGKIQHQANKTQCHYDSERLTLTLVLLDARPRNHGTYYCKLRSNLGISHTNTTVLPTACEGSFEHRALQNPPREECLFYDVYPESHVLWFSEGKDLTASSIDNKTLLGADGLYNISSAFPREENMANLSCRLSGHNSSYAIPSRQDPKTGASHDIIIYSNNNSSSSSCTGLHWLLFFALLMLPQWE